MAGIILNRGSATPSLAEQTNPAVIEALTGRPILARVPEIGNLNEASGREALITALDGVPLLGKSIAPSPPFSKAASEPP